MWGSVARVQLVDGFLAWGNKTKGARRQDVSLQMCGLSSPSLCITAEMNSLRIPFVGIAAQISDIAASLALATLDSARDSPPNKENARGFLTHFPGVFFGGCY